MSNIAERKEKLTRRAEEIRRKEKLRKSQDGLTLPVCSVAIVIGLFTGSMIAWAVAVLFFIAGCSGDSDDESRELVNIGVALNELNELEKNEST